MEAWVQDRHIFYKDNSYCHREYMLVPAGLDEIGRQLFVALNVYEGKLPRDKKDYVYLERAIAPKGYKWYSNNKSRFGGEYETVLVKEIKK